MYYSLCFNFCTEKCPWSKSVMYALITRDADAMHASIGLYYVYSDADDVTSPYMCRVCAKMQHRSSATDTTTFLMHLTWYIIVNFCSTYLNGQVYNSYNIKLFRSTSTISLTWFRVILQYYGYTLAWTVYIWVFRCSTILWLQQKCIQCWVGVGFRPSHACNTALTVPSSMENRCFTIFSNTFSIV